MDGNMKRDLLTIKDLKASEIKHLIKRAFVYKDLKSRDRAYRPLKGKILALLFEKPSTRTRVSFEAGMYQLGGNVVCMNVGDTQLARGEALSDTSRVLSSYVDGIVVRCSTHAHAEELARHATVPVINGLTDLHHPCQVLSDLMTIVENKNGLDGLKVAWVGDGNNMAHSWINAASRMGFDLYLACPKKYEPRTDILREARRVAKGEIRLTHDPIEAVRGADVLCTDVWISMGQEDEEKNRRRDFKGYQANKKLLSYAKDDVIVMHCLPAHRGEEITDDIIEGEHSVVFSQAENRLYLQKALLEMFLGGKGPGSSRRGGQIVKAEP
jgi:ornithine carbamoyltransferase